MPMNTMLFLENSLFMENVRMAFFGKHWIFPFIPNMGAGTLERGFNWIFNAKLQRKPLIFKGYKKNL